MAGGVVGEVGVGVCGVGGAGAGAALVDEDEPVVVGVGELGPAGVGLGAGAAVDAQEGGSAGVAEFLPVQFLAVGAGEGAGGVGCGDGVHSGLFSLWEPVMVAAVGGVWGGFSPCGGGSGVFRVWGWFSGVGVLSGCSTWGLSVRGGGSA